MIEPTNEDIGRTVIYVRGNPPFEEGTITFVGEFFVFVRYGNDNFSKATRREDLEWGNVDE